MKSVGTPTFWAGFIVLVLLLLAADLGLFQRGKSKDLTFRQAAVMCTIWVSLALGFNAGVYYYFGRDRALEFLTGYLLEEALSIDNIFVFVVIFKYFGIKRELQRRVLYWGIIGALVLRAIFIFAGTALIQKFHWVTYVFGAILVYTGLKLFKHDDDAVDPSDNPLTRVFRRLFPMTKDLRGEKFTVIENGKRYATPLLLTLVTIEASDVIFAVDSIPAVFAVTTDPFIVFTSNIFAILGLRSLYFLLATIVHKFHLLKYGLAVVLIFVGAKMLVAYFDIKIPIAISLGIIALLLAGSVVASLMWPPKAKDDEPFPEVDVVAAGEGVAAGNAAAGDRAARADSADQKKRAVAPDGERAKKKKKKKPKTDAAATPDDVT